MSNLKAVLTFDDSWDDEAVRNAFADNDQFPGVTVAEVTSTECGGCARQNKGSAEQQTITQQGSEPTEILLCALKGKCKLSRKMCTLPAGECVDQRKTSAVA